MRAIEPAGVCDRRRSRAAAPRGRELLLRRARGLAQGDGHRTHGARRPLRRRAQRLRVRRAPPRARREARADLARRRAARAQGLRPQGQPGQTAPLPAGLLSVGAGLLPLEHGEDGCRLGARPVAGEQLRAQAAGHGRHVVAPRAVRRLHVLQPRGGRGLVGRVRAHDAAHAGREY